jgi:choline dehydrogenase-like flavoprotein
MLVDALRLERKASFEVDICIVGGDVAGITIALKLAESGLRICLLEGGGRSILASVASAFLLW